jgi:hypothetical protein
MACATLNRQQVGRDTPFLGESPIPGLGQPSGIRADAPVGLPACGRSSAIRAGAAACFCRAPGMLSTYMIAQRRKAYAIDCGEKRQIEVEYSPLYADVLDHSSMNHASRREERRRRWIARKRDAQVNKLHRQIVAGHGGRVNLQLAYGERARYALEKSHIGLHPVPEAPS